MPPLTLKTCFFYFDEFWKHPVHACVLVFVFMYIILSILLSHQLRYLLCIFVSFFYFDCLFLLLLFVFWQLVHYNVQLVNQIYVYFYFNMSMYRTLQKSKYNPTSSTLLNFYSSIYLLNTFCSLSQNKYLAYCFPYQWKTANVRFTLMTIISVVYICFWIQEKNFS